MAPPNHLPGVNDEKRPRSADSDVPWFARSAWLRWLVPTTDLHQALRIQRFGMALLVYAFCFALAALCVSLGLVARAPILYALAPAVVLNAWLYGMFRSGRNTRWEDPSLTLVQTLAATAFVMYGVYIADGARMLFVMLYPIPFLFGAFRLKLVEHLLVAAFALAAYALAIGLAWQWKPHTVQLGQELLQWLVLAIELGWFAALGHALKSMRRRAVFDTLTGVLNRHALLDALDLEEQRRQRGGPTFCVCMIDIDHLKHINEARGIDGGDAVLKRFARMVRSNLRTVDSFGRYGADEFLLMLNNTDREQAVVTVDRIRRAVDAERLTEYVPPIAFSISVGIAEHDRDEAVSRTITRADAALGEAKRAGRNRVAVAANASDGPPRVIDPPDSIAFGVR